MLTQWKNKGLLNYNKKHGTWSIHNWDTKKECIIQKKLQKKTLDFCLSSIIIIVMDCYMPIDKMVFLINKII
jgi:hypothetical protein